MDRDRAAQPIEGTAAHAQSGQVAGDEDRAGEVAGDRHGVDVAEGGKARRRHLSRVRGVRGDDRPSRRQGTADAHQIHRAGCAHRARDVARHREGRQGVIHRDRATERIQRAAPNAQSSEVAGDEEGAGQVAGDGRGIDIG